MFPKMSKYNLLSLAVRQVVPTKCSEITEVFSAIRKDYKNAKQAYEKACDRFINAISELSQLGDEEKERLESCINEVGTTMVWNLYVATNRLSSTDKDKLWFLSGEATQVIDKYNEKYGLTKRN